MHPHNLHKALHKPRTSTCTNHAPFRHWLVLAHQQQPGKAAKHEGRHASKQDFASPLDAATDPDYGNASAGPPDCADATRKSFEQWPGGISVTLDNSWGFIILFTLIIVLIIVLLSRTTTCTSHTAHALAQPSAQACGKLIRTSLCTSPGLCAQRFFFYEI